MSRPNWGPVPAAALPPGPDRAALLGRRPRPPGNGLRPPAHPRRLPAPARARHGSARIRPTGPYGPPVRGMHRRSTTFGRSRNCRAVICCALSPSAVSRFCRSHVDSQSGRAKRWATDSTSSTTLCQYHPVPVPPRASTTSCQYHLVPVPPRAQVVSIRHRQEPPVQPQLRIPHRPGEDPAPLPPGGQGPGALRTCPGLITGCGGGRGCFRGRYELVGRRPCWPGRRGGGCLGRCRGGRS
jgi:hypothetical protein